MRAGATKLQKGPPDFLKKYGLDAPDVSSEDTVGVDDFFKWLRACIAMLDAGAHFNEDINAVVAVRMLSAAVYSLFPYEAAGASTVTKAQLRCLRDEGFPWPGEDAICPEALPALAKNTAKNVVDHFFKGERCAIVRREVERMKAQVVSCLLFDVFFFILLFFALKCILTSLIFRAL